MACRVQYSIQNNLRFFSSSSSPIIHTHVKSQRVHFRNSNYGAFYCTSTVADPFAPTTPLYYVNAPPHMDSAYTIAADAIARFQRLLGKKVIFITGTDELGEKIVSSAAANGSNPSEHCDFIAQAYKALWKEAYLTTSSFARPIPIMNPLSRNSTQRFLPIVISTVLTMRDYIVSTVRNIRCKAGSKVA